MEFNYHTCNIQGLYQIADSLCSDQREEFDCKISKIEELVNLEKSFHETDKNFKIHPFIIYHNENGFDQTAEKLGLRHEQKFLNKLSDVFENWCFSCEERYGKFLLTYRIIYDLCVNKYKLDLDSIIGNQKIIEDVTPIEVPNLTENVKEFISYCIGCYFGLFSWKEKKYISERAISAIQKRLKNSPNFLELNSSSSDGTTALNWILFFLSEIYGEEYLEENLLFIADALSSKGESAFERIHNYVSNEFYFYHIKQYKDIKMYKITETRNQKKLTLLL